MDIGDLFGACIGSCEGGPAGLGVKLNPAWCGLSCGRVEGRISEALLGVTELLFWLYVHLSRRESFLEQFPHATLFVLTVF